MTDNVDQDGDASSVPDELKSTVIGSDSGAPMPFLGQLDDGPKVDGYIVESKPIGAGTFGAVFRARHTQTTEMSAIKVLTASFSTKLDQERFRREMQTGHLLRVDQIVAFMSSGECKEGKYAGRPYFVMEYLNVGSFRSWLEKLDLSSEHGIRSAIRILIDVCKGLQALHDHNIIHRDLKPSNILLGNLQVVEKDGCPKELLDSSLTRRVSRIQRYDASPAIDCEGWRFRISAICGPR